MLEHVSLRVFEVLVRRRPGGSCAGRSPSVALRTSIGSRRKSVAVEFQQVEGIEEGDRLVPAAAQDVEPGEPALVAADHLPVDQAGPHLEVVHGLDHEREAVRPVIAAPGNQPDADGIAPRHQAVAVVLDFVNPVGAGRRAVGR